jgi:hypothetical protein
VTRVNGSAIAAVRSSPLAASCGPFDACGLTGTVDVVPQTTPGASVSLTAEASLRRPKRDLLAALGLARHGNPSGIDVYGYGYASARGTVTADLSRGGACHDSVGLRGTTLELMKRTGRLNVSLTPTNSQAADPLRTRCPGPDLGQRQLTSASLPLSVLRRSTFTVKLRGGSFNNGPYRVSTRSTLTVTLHRTRVTTQVVSDAARSG